MPELVDVAAHFDDIAVLDGYTGDKLFDAQFNTFDESSISGNVEKKRTMSVRYGTSMPARRLITMFGERWVIGGSNTDGIYNTAIRSSYWLKRSEDLMSVLTPAQALAGSGGFTAYASRMFDNDTQNNGTDSQLDPYWSVFFSTSENVATGSILKLGTKYFRVRSMHDELSGFRLAASDELDTNPLVTVGITQQTGWNPITEVNSTSQVNVPGLLLNMYKLYRLGSTSDRKLNPGDMSLLTAAPIVAGSTVMVNGVRMTVADCQPELDAYLSHLFKP